MLETIMWGLVVAGLIVGAFVFFLLIALWWALR